MAARAPTIQSEEGEEEADRHIFEVTLHAAHGGVDEDGSEASRPQPLAPDLAQALEQAMQVESDPAQPAEGLQVLLQVCQDKERALGWRPSAQPLRVATPPVPSTSLPGVPACSSTASGKLQAGLTLPPLLSPVNSRVSTGESLPSPEELVHLSLCVRIPLLLSSVTVVDGETAEPCTRSPTERGVRPRYLVALVTQPGSDSVHALQALELSNSALGASVRSSDPNGTWLVECKDEGERSTLLQSLQMAGCIMNDIGARYRMGQLLGVGASAKVFMAEDSGGGEEVAVKIVAKRGPEHDLAVLKEATILRWAQHDSVLQFLGIYDIQDPATGNGAWAIVTDFVGGGELFEEVRRKGPFSEDRACDVIAQLFSALDFLHHRGIVHRDIKTENVCKTGCGDDVKLVDFGLASPEWDVEAMLTKCGSPGYIAPEVLRGERYGCKVDCFSVGVLMFILLLGYGPFRGRTIEEMLRRNIRCKIKEQDLAKCSSEAKALLEELLLPTANRPTAERALHFPWVVEHSSGLRFDTETTNPLRSEASMLGSSGGYPSQLSKSEQPARRGRRRLYSTQLRASDMFKQLKFAEVDAPDDLSPGALAAVEEAASRAGGPSPWQSAGSDGGRERDGASAASPPRFSPLVPAAAEADGKVIRRPSNPATGSDGLQERLTGRSRATGGDSEYRDVRSGKSGPSTAQSPRSPTSPWAAGAEQPPPRHSLPCMSAESIKTSEPLWAGVQQRVLTLKTQGIISPKAGVARGSRKDSQNGRRRRARTRPAEEREELREELLRFRKLQRCATSYSSRGEKKAQRTAFAARDAGRHGSNVSVLSPTSHASERGSGELEMEDMRTSNSVFFMQQSDDDDSDHGGDGGGIELPMPAL